MVADIRPRWADGTVVASEPVADRVRRITVRRPSSERAAPGSHVDVRVEVAQGQYDVRSYSVVESNADGSELVLSVLLTQSSRGGSRFMHELRAGDTLRCTQPLQSFELRLGAPRQVLLAGGIGITALAAMADVLARQRADYDLVYVGRSRTAMAYLGALRERHGDRLRVHVDDEGTGLDVPALVAEVTESDHARQTELYMCGPIRLMDACRRAWAAAGLPPYHLRFETFGNSGWFDPEEFEVVVPRLGLHARVGRDSTILESLVAAGAEMMFDCRKGECGLCQVDVVDAAGELDHRDVFLSARQQRTGRILCSCVSRVAAGTDGGRPVLTLDLP